MISCQVLITFVQSDVSQVNMYLAYFQTRFSRKPNVVWKNSILYLRLVSSFGIPKFGNMLHYKTYFTLLNEAKCKPLRSCLETKVLYTSRTSQRKRNRRIETPSTSCRSPSGVPFWFISFFRGDSTTVADSSRYSNSLTWFRMYD